MPGPNRMLSPRGPIGGALVLAVALAVSPAAFATDYVGDLDGLESAPSRYFEMFYERPGVDLGAYQSLYLAPIEVLADDSEVLPELEDATIGYLLADLAEQLADKLAGLYPAAEAPAPGVLVLKVVVRDLVPNRPESVPGLWQGGGRTSVQIGSATVQGTLEDGGSGERLIAFVDRDEGAPFATNYNLTSVWGDVYDAFRDMSRQLARKLAEIKGRSAP